jgi:hypothetical protein
VRWRRIGAGVALSLGLHLLVALLLARVAPRPPPPAPPVEIALVEAAPAPAAALSPAERSPAPPTAPAPPTRRRTTRRASTEETARASAEAAPSSPGQPAAPAGDDSLMRMRGGAIDLMPGDDTLARALGPVEAPPAPDKPARRKPRLPGTGLTTLEPQIDEKVRMIHPRFFDVLAGAEKSFRPEPQRLIDEVKGELAAGKTIKRWLFGGLGGDVDALKNQVPTLACLVCVTLRVGKAPDVELAGASGSAWFDRAATESIRRAVSPRPEDDRTLDPARACYRFAAKIYRQRPDLTNLSIPFKLVFRSSVTLISYQKLGS